MLTSPFHHLPLMKFDLPSHPFWQFYTSLVYSSQTNFSPHTLNSSCRKMADLQVAAWKRGRRDTGKTYKFHIILGMTISMEATAMDEIWWNSPWLSTHACASTHESLYGWSYLLTGLAATNQGTEIPFSSHISLQIWKVWDKFHWVMSGLQFQEQQGQWKYSYAQEHTGKLGITISIETTARLNIKWGWSQSQRDKQHPT